MASQKATTPRVAVVTGTSSGIGEAVVRHFCEQGHQVLALLEEEDRKIIVLKDLKDLSYDEIAVILEVPKGTVRSRLHRARLQLKEKWTNFSGTSSREEAS